MSAIGPIIVFAVLIGAWWLVARRLKASGRGMCLSHLAGAAVGSLAMFTSAAILIGTGVIESGASEKVTASVEAATVTPMAQETAPPLAPAVAPTPETTPEYDLSLTPTDFVANMNIALPLVGFKTQLPHETTIVKGDVNDVYRGGINKNLQLIATISKDSGNIKSVTLLAAGDGSPKSGADVMLAGVAVYMAASDMADESGKKPNADMFMDLLKQMSDTNDTASNVIGTRKYSIVPMESLGTWISVEAVN